jgi:hypothetical protein
MNINYFYNNYNINFSQKTYYRKFKKHKHFQYNLYIFRTYNSLQKIFKINKNRSPHFGYTGTTDTRAHEESMGIRAREHTAKLRAHGQSTGPGKGPQSIHEHSNQR